MRQDCTKRYIVYETWCLNCETKVKKDTDEVMDVEKVEIEVTKEVEVEKEVLKCCDPPHYQ